MSKIIGDLSKQHRSAKFEPHVTVYSGICEDRESIIRSLLPVFLDFTTIRLEVVGVRASEDFFKTLFLEFKENLALNELKDKITGVLQPETDYLLRPHLSLMYKELNFDQKSEIARAINIDKDDLIFDEVKLVSPKNSELGWRDITSWEAWFSYKVAP